MSNVYEVMNEVRSRDWFPNTRWTELTYVDDNIIEVQIPRIKPKGLTDLQEMNQINIERIGGALEDGITIVLEVQ